MRSRYLHERERREDVQTPLCFELALVEILQGDDSRAAGVVHQHVDPSELAKTGVDDEARSIGVGQVSSLVPTATRSRCLLERNLVAPNEKKTGPRPSEANCCRETDPATGPRDDAGLPLEF